jgi:two-component system chemotaxis response regulator CheY
MKALVIDDSRAMRAILRSLLSDIGYKVSEASNGKEALTVLKDSPDLTLALVDWNMPEMNGLEFVQALRKDARYAGVRLVMCTTETEMSQVERALASGANEYVMKPFTKDVIREKLATLGMAA